MMWTALILLAVYVALKSGQFAFLGKASGYRGEPVSLGRRLRKGEPALLIIAALITVPPVLAGTWYHRHKFEEVLRNSVKCYGLVQAYQNAPEIKRSNGGYAVYESVYGYRWAAFDASRQLGSDAKAVQQRLDEAALAMAAESRRAGAGVRHERLSVTQSCLHPPKEPPNA
ncbi:MAG: hypothetical protein M3438_11270 [Pseudomonadota bacterium]|nr:hypothetical protein [Pseudomonadota bacterium]